jgi:hypothetical protein
MQRTRDTVMGGGRSQLRDSDALTWDISSATRFATRENRMRYDGSWILAAKKMRARIAVTHTIFTLLVVTSLLALIFSGLIKSETSHSLDVNEDALCTTGTDAALHIRAKLHWTTGGNVALNNDRKLLDLALGMLAPAVLFFTIGFIALWSTPARYILARPGNWSIAWRVLTFVFGGIALLIAIFCVVWAASGYAVNFDATTKCSGNSIITVDLQDGLNTRVERYAVAAAILAIAAMFSLFMLVLRIYTGSDSRGTLSVENEVLHWLSSPLHNANGDPVAPLASVYANALIAIGENPSQTILVGTAHFKGVLFKDIDPSPETIEAIWAAKAPAKKQGDILLPLPLLQNIQRDLASIPASTVSGTHRRSLDSARTALAELMISDAPEPPPTDPRAAKLYAATRSLLRAV